MRIIQLTTLITLVYSKEIWSDDMDMGIGWTVTQNATGSLSDTNCDSNACVFLSNNGMIQYNGLSTLNYNTIQLKYSLKAANLGDSDQCNVAYSIDQRNWIQLAQYDHNDNDIKYMEQIINMNSDANNKNTLSIQFNSQTGSESYCFIDEIYLFGTPGSKSTTLSNKFVTKPAQKLANYNTQETVSEFRGNKDNQQIQSIFAEYLLKYAYWLIAITLSSKLFIFMHQSESIIMIMLCLLISLTKFAGTDELWYDSMDGGTGWTVVGDAFVGGGFQTNYCDIPNCVFLTSDSSITSPVISTLNYKDIELRYSIFIRRYDSGTDKCTVSYKVGSGNWNELAVYDYLDNTISYDNVYKNLNPDANDQSSISIKYETSAQNDDECYIDEIYIYGTPIVPTTSPTPAQTSTSTPTLYPSKYPTFYPTKYPTLFPTKYPTLFPSKYPTLFPTRYPTLYPSTHPIKYPTEQPTFYPSKYPSKIPTNDPSKKPTGVPSNHPSNDPTSEPTANPTAYPTNGPTKYPSLSPNLATPCTEDCEGGIVVSTTEYEPDNDSKQGDGENPSVFSDEYLINNWLYLVGSAIICLCICCIVLFCFRFRHKLNKKKQTNDKNGDKPSQKHLERVTSMSMTNTEIEMHNYILNDNMSPKQLPNLPIQSASLPKIITPMMLMPYEQGPDKNDNLHAMSIQASGNDCDIMLTPGSDIEANMIKIGGEQDNQNGLSVCGDETNVNTMVGGSAGVNMQQHVQENGYDKYEYYYEDGDEDEDEEDEDEDEGLYASNLRSVNTPQ